MSDSTGPVRRRRIAGERKPAAPVTKPAAKKATPQRAATPPIAPASVATRKAARPPKATTPSESPSEESARQLLRWRIPVALVTAAALIGGALLLVTGVSRVRGGGPDLDASRKEAVAAATTAVETVFTYRYDQLGEHLSASTALMTKSFAKTFRDYDPALVKLAPQRKVQLRSVTREAAVLPCGDECSSAKLNVLVFYDQVRLLGDSTTPTVFAKRASVSMVRTDQGWLVDDVRAL